MQIVVLGIMVQVEILAPSLQLPQIQGFQIIITVQVMAAVLAMEVTPWPETHSSRKISFSNNNLLRSSLI